MKKITYTILALFILVVAYQPLSAECSTQKILIKRNGQPVDLQNQVIEKDSHILVPFFYLPKLCDCKANWDNNISTVKIQNARHEIEYLIGAKLVKVNNKTISTDTSAQIINGTVMVPLAFTMQQLGAIVKWDEINNAILLYDSINNIYTEDQLHWALATYQIELVINGRYFSFIPSSSVPTEEFQQQARKNLEIGWGIFSREGALQCMERLKESGHRKDFERTVEFVSSLSDDEYYLLLSNISNNSLTNRLALVRENYEIIGSKSLMAWDFCRLAFVAENSYIVGYITEQEAWDNIMMSAREIQKTFSSWEDMANNFLLGYQYWDGPAYPLFESTVRILLDKSSSASPWNKYDWNMSLEPKQLESQ